jgi:3-hydroxymyristoyl/3-hydroxydecanoyl-(acyl carrier protein) dehydratase
MLVFPAGHACFSGHFPSNPIVPAVALLAELVRDVEGRTGKVVSGVKGARFYSVLRPDAVLSVAMDAPSSSEDVVRVSCRNGKSLVVRASFLVSEV